MPTALRAVKFLKYIFSKFISFITLRCNLWWSNDELFPVHSGTRVTAHPTPADVRLWRRAQNVVNRNQWWRQLQPMSHSCDPLTLLQQEINPLNEKMNYSSVVESPAWITDQPSNIIALPFSFEGLACGNALTSHRAVVITCNCEDN